MLKAVFLPVLFEERSAGGSAAQAFSGGHAGAVGAE